MADYIFSMLKRLGTNRGDCLIKDGFGIRNLKIAIKHEHRQFYKAT